MFVITLFFPLFYLFLAAIFGVRLLRAIHHAQPLGAGIYAALLVALSGAGAAYTLATMGGGFGFGVFMCLGSTFGSLILIPAAWGVGKGSALFGAPEFWRQMAAWGALALIVLSAFSPLIGVQVISHLCDRLNEQHAAPIIEAAQEVYDNTSVYPTNLAALGLSPDVPHCTGLLRLGNPNASPVIYEFETCSDGTTLLTFYAMNGVGVERYDFSRARWIGSVSWLDGACSFLN